VTLLDSVKGVHRPHDVHSFKFYPACPGGTRRQALAASAGVSLALGARAWSITVAARDGV